MKKYTVSILLSLGCCTAWAQSDVGVSATVSESTDPPRAAEVERKAQEISNQDDRSSGSSGKEEQVRFQSLQGWYFKVASTRSSDLASKAPTYPTHSNSKITAKLQ